MQRNSGREIHGTKLTIKGKATPVPVGADAASPAELGQFIWHEGAG